MLKTWQYKRWRFIKNVFKGVCDLYQLSLFSNIYVLVIFLTSSDKVKIPFGVSVSAFRSFLKQCCCTAPCKVSAASSSFLFYCDISFSFKVDGTLHTVGEVPALLFVLIKAAVISAHLGLNLDKKIF